MPYIKQERQYLKVDNVPIATTPGELNYQLTTVIRAYYENQGTSYQAINDILGALEGAKLEFYRRVVAPYEDKKIKENGDVY